ncbi:transposase [Bremerella sp. JC770]|uniref:transposase n=1 Tax=Bremerella sp. JC770 TaxID=3232137 RepID=UPI00345A6AB1
MAWDAVMKQFAQDSPACVMFRGTLQRLFAADRLDQLFNETAVRQENRELLFSMCVDLMALVVAKIHPSVHAAYQRRKEQLGVSVNAVYDKLAGIEPIVSQRLVHDIGQDLKQVMHSLQVPQASPLEGYQLRIVDGNHLAGTEHRLKELRTLGAAALPGHALAVLNPQSQLIEGIIPCEDGHANERVLLPELLTWVQPGHCWVADRNFCTLDFLFGIHERGSHFIIRQHGKLEGKAIGRRRKLGTSATGTVYQQQLEITRKKETLTLRRITVELNAKTRDGDLQIHVLTNLPEEISGVLVTGTYRDRWSLETAFQHLATALRSEVNTLAYPDAALFGFAIGVVLYNVLSTMRAALQIAHKLDGVKRKVSYYYLADEIAGVYRGMMIAVPPPRWESTFADLTLDELGKTLVDLAKKAQVRQYLTNPTSHKKPPPPKQSGRRGNHVSTQRILEKRSKTNTS